MMKDLLLWLTNNSVKISFSKFFHYFLFHFIDTKCNCIHLLFYHLLFHCLFIQNNQLASDKEVKKINKKLRLTIWRILMKNSKKSWIFFKIYSIIDAIERAFFFQIYHLIKKYQSMAEEVDEICKNKWFERGSTSCVHYFCCRHKINSMNS